MRLKKYSYAQFIGTPREWIVDGLELGEFNLVVGKNATGKSRTLNTIAGLSKLVSGRMKPSELATGEYHAIFEHEGRELSYNLIVKDRKVVEENFTDEERVLLTRGVGGIGKIYHEKEQKSLDFQTPESDVAAVSRRDSLQHPFLEPLGSWGTGVRHYEFGSTMGKDSVVILVTDAPPPDPCDRNQVIALFRKADQEFPDKFREMIIKEMDSIGYDLEEIGTMIATDVRVVKPSLGPTQPYILFVKERDLPAKTQQTEMSQGMFRALSVLIHLAYGVLADKPTLIIVDDIGEGLDFDRSVKLIDAIRRLAKNSAVQILLATNDKFVMNEVPLEEWSVLQRVGSHVKVLNYINSRKVFEEFRFTGLSNFSFFEMDFASHPPTEEVSALEKVSDLC